MTLNIMKYNHSYQDFFSEKYRIGWFKNEYFKNFVKRN